MNGRAWKAWLVPGGLLLAVVATLVNSSLFNQIAPSLSFYYVAAFAAGLLLAWRFNSSRVFFSLLVLLLAHRAVDFYSFGGPLHVREIHTGPGGMALALVALLIPLNFTVLSLMRERGLIIAGIAPRFGLVFLQSVFFAVLCRPENSPASLHHPAGPAIPLWILLSFPAAVAVFVRRFFQTRKPIEPGFVWAVAAVFLWLQFAPVGRMSDAYVGTAALILAASLIETSYVLAYHDELTGIRGRRAFNESLLSLEQQYAIAIVDIDHFKKFNDTYGHDVGDQVLCMVAKRLSQVGGDGQAFRCGGEEFAIVFRNISAREAFEHLDALRQIIEKSAFHRRSAERRSERKAGESAENSGNRRSREPDRRRSRKKNVDPNPRLGKSVDFEPDLKMRNFGRAVRRTKSAESSAAHANPIERVDVSQHSTSQSPDRLSVTVSIGIAEPSTRYRQPEQVIQAADQALYRAKHKGRNRVELASTALLGIAAGKRAKASRI
jgi:diguanylate cyclase (GGDEF)-like protein